METGAFKISDEEKIENAKRYKAEGNDFYKRKDFRKAIGKYHRGLLQLKAVGNDKNLSNMLGMLSPGSSENLSPETKEQCSSLKVDCYNNLAACLLQQGDANYEKVLEYCTHVLEANPSSVKGRYRKGVALYNLEKYEEALQTFSQIEAPDSTTKNYITKCKHGMQKDDRELKDTYKAMFSKGSENT